MDAARRMVGGDDSDSGVFDAIGLPEAYRNKLLEKSDIDIWPEHWEAVAAFGAMQTQWRIGMGGPTGLDYTALPVVMDMLEIADRRQAFDGLIVMERTALESFRENNGK